MRRCHSGAGHGSTTERAPGIDPAESAATDSTGIRKRARNASHARAERSFGSR